MNNPDRTQETSRPERRSNRSFRTALAFRLGMAFLAAGSALSGSADSLRSRITGEPTPIASAAECVGPDVPCLTPDGIDRRGSARVFRTLIDEKNDFYAISNAAVRVYIIEPNGTSDYPEFDRENPVLGQDGLPTAFKNLKNGELRKVEKQVLFKAAEPGDPRFDGELINTETGSKGLAIERNGNEIKDRAIGKTRGESECAADDLDCQLNCAQTVVWERQVSADKPVPFKDSAGKPERFQTAIWLWNGAVNSIHDLVSFTRLSKERIFNLIKLGQAAPGIRPRMSEVTE